MSLYLAYGAGLLTGFVLAYVARIRDRNLMALQYQKRLTILADALFQEEYKK